VKRRLGAALLLASIATAVTAAATTAQAAMGPQSTAAGTATATTAPIYVTLLFSRSEVSAADNCVPNSTNVARLDSEIAPWLAQSAITGTGTLQTASVEETTQHCTHHQGSLTASWADAKALSDRGWSFVSHTATYPGNMAALSPSQSYAETCGSAQTIDAHGLRGGHGLIAYPGAQPSPTALQTNYGQYCFSWGRQYGGNATTTAAAATTEPYWQNTGAPNGGPCNVRTAPCYSIAATGSTRYATPARVLAKVAALQPGDWFTLQSYLEVKGVNPPYTSSPIRWDCRSADPNLHWSNDNERYCYRDWQVIVQKLMTLPNVVFTDPETVGVAFGRSPTPAPAGPSRGRHLPV